MATSSLISAAGSKPSGEEEDMDKKVVVNPEMLEQGKVDPVTY